jgi:arylsulfatase A-like enzyme
MNIPCPSVFFMLLSGVPKRSKYYLRFCLMIVLNLCFIIAQAQDRPNVVWIVTEDNSKHYLKLYDQNGVSMPTIERLAEQGIVFNNAFSQAPVCSVARSTIISGCYAPRVGAQYHRTMKKVPMPEGLRMFPYYLRQAGYYTTNNNKEDYNFIKGEGVWDNSSNKATYRDRKKGQAFFHVQNFGITHEGRLHFNEKEMQENETNTDPKSMIPPPYHPNTSTFRYTQSLYHDLHQRADQAMERFLEQLEEDGLLEDTFIFYYGDHGGVLPGSKGYIYERGVHVPLVVYVPEKWKHLVPVERGSRVDGFVRFIDLAPTVLNLAGVEIPDEMDGSPFLGHGLSEKEINSRNAVFCYADRFDEKYDLVRSVRVGKYKYIRNYQPFNFDGLYNFYRYRMLAYQEWLQLYKEGKLNETQQQFFEPRLPEALYNVEEDPYEINNLVASGRKKGKLRKLRKILQQQVKSLPDLSFYPEHYLLQMAWDNPVQFGRQNREEIARLIDVADLSLKPFKDASDDIANALHSPNPWERYWGLIVCSSFGKEASAFFDKARALAESDEENLVRVRAAEFLGLTKAETPVPVLTECLQKAQTSAEANLILNTIVLMRDTNPDYKFSLQKEMVNPQFLRGKDSVVKERLIYLGVDIKVD